MTGGRRPRHGRPTTLVGEQSARVVDATPEGRSGGHHAAGGRVPTGSKGVVVKKGRHRRFEEARSLKRSVTTDGGRCPECGAEPDDVHASWCLAEEDRYDRILGSVTEEREPDPLDD
ncbi:MAG: hypothetical protein ACRDYZ_09285 [Acidimicrobiales bacterium]